MYIKYLFVLYSAAATTTATLIICCITHAREPTRFGISVIRLFLPHFVSAHLFGAQIFSSLSFPHNSSPLVVDVVLFHLPKLSKQRNCDHPKTKISVAAIQKAVEMSRLLLVAAAIYFCFVNAKQKLKNKEYPSRNFPLCLQFAPNGSAYTAKPKISTK